MKSSKGKFYYDLWSVVGHEALILQSGEFHIPKRFFLKKR
jgi:hypothetical protein